VATGSGIKRASIWSRTVRGPRDHPDVDLSPFGFPKRREAVVILGAGATRGASFGSVSPVLRPPMDMDFFQQLRASELSGEDAALRLLEFIREEFGEAELSMEAFYSQVHLHDQFLTDLPKGKARRRRYEWARRYFLRVIPPMFEATLALQRCAWHDALIGALMPGDTIISFNYDCLVDAPRFVTSDAATGIRSRDTALRAMEPWMRGGTTPVPGAFPSDHCGY
jgi:hypothetical protein